MLNTIAKRIQSRLSRLGVKASLGDIKSRCEKMIVDIENPTEDDLLAVQEYFMKNATQLTIATDIDNDIDTASIQDIDSALLYIQEDVEEAIAPPQPDPAPLATTNKSEVVTATASQRY